MTRSAESSRSAPVEPQEPLTAHTQPSGANRRRRRGPSRRSGARVAAPPRPEPALPSYEASPFDPAPIPFTELPLDPTLLTGIRDLGWTETRPVQSGVIPFALGSHDVIACAETGTGKTAAFLVPILQRFLTESGIAGSGT